jgi:hypothetical protein
MMGSPHGNLVVVIAIIWLNQKVDHKQDGPKR